MTSGIEEAGAMGTAAAAASVLAGPHAGAPGASGACLNCNAALQGPFCAQCGQHAHVHRSVLHAVEEFLHGIVHFDGRFWNTLPLLIFRPGRLTRDYVMGRRARYIAPVAVFLLTIFAMFLLFAFLPGPSGDAAAVKLDGPERAAAVADLKERRLAAQRELDQMEARLAADPGNSQLATDVKILEASIGVMSSAEERVRRDGEANAGDFMRAIGNAAASGDLSLDVGDETTNARIRDALSNPEFVFYKMKQKGYKLSFLLVPLSLPWLILLFAWKRDAKVYDHVVFLLYSISFMSLVVMLVALLFAAGVTAAPVYGTLLVAVPLVHMFAQLKEGYALGWFSAAWRTLALALAALVTLGIYLTGIGFLGLLD